ncbi:Uma2 family endonuclease [Streptomyces sp. NPDC048604]|uniref:Uma2 family endonuclease n=1 Tax=Streptomyces sp. NPDC048604 TaxID=3365578 RepID=UPI00371D419A
MSALAAEPEPHWGNGWEDLVRRWETMDWPEGCKVEIIEGIITVSPSPTVRHNLAASRVHRRLHSVIPDDWEVFQTQSIAVASRLGMFIPDLVVVPAEAADGRPGYYIPAEPALLVAEVTSPSNANHDRIMKAAAYAEAGVPLYLLIDAYAPGGPTVTLYGEPKDDVYRVLRAVPFGEKIQIPAPFDLTLDTAEFPVS